MSRIQAAKTGPEERKRSGQGRSARVGVGPAEPAMTVSALA